MATQAYTNDYSSTLTSSYTSGGGSLVVNSVTGLPTSGFAFYLKVDSEYFLVASYTGTTLTVTGGQQGSSASNHASGAVITGCWWLPAVVDGIRSDQSQRGAYSSLPTSGMKKGDQFQATDCAHHFIYDGSNWQGDLSGVPATPVALANFSWVNQGSATAMQSGAGVYVTIPAVSGDQYRVLEKSMPTAPFTATIQFAAAIPNKTFCQCGVVLRDSSSGKMVTCAVVTQASSDFWQLTAAKLTNTTTFSASYQVYDIAPISPFWLRIRDDATNRFFGYSSDGFNWWEFFSVGDTDFVTPNQVGFYGDTNNTVAPMNFTVLSYLD